MYLIEVILVIPDAAQGSSDSQIAFTYSCSCACIVSRLSIKLHFVIFPVQIRSREVRKKERKWILPMRSWRAKPQTGAQRFNTE